MTSINSSSAASILSGQFSEASRRWPNLTSILVTWPENMQRFDIEWLPSKLQPQYASGSRSGSSVGWTASMIDTQRGDSANHRFVTGVAGMLFFSRGFGQHYDRRAIRDPDEVQAISERWRTLADHAAQMFCDRPTSPPIDTHWYKFSPDIWWQLFLHIRLPHPQRKLKEYYEISVIDDVFLASALDIDRLGHRPSDDDGAGKSELKTPADDAKPASVPTFPASVNVPTSTRPAALPSESFTATKGKRSTERGEGRTKLIAALTKHHKYADGSCLNTEPVNNNELARLSDVAGATASEFFKKEFGGHGKYRSICTNVTNLVTSLKLLNQEFSPHLLFGATPHNESEPERD